MAMQRIEDMSALEIEAAFGDYFETIAKKKDPLVGYPIVSEGFWQDREVDQGIQGGFRRGEMNIICAGSVQNDKV